MNVLQSEYRKTHPDFSTVKDRMAGTFSWRHHEIMEGMPVGDVLNKYPYLRTRAGVSTVKKLECYRGALSIYVIIQNIVKFKTSFAVTENKYIKSLLQSVTVCKGHSSEA